MLTPCLLIPRSTAAFFIFSTFSQGCVCFPSADLFSHPLKFLYFPPPLLSDQMLINSLHAVGGGEGGRGLVRALGDTAWIEEWVTVFLLKQLSPSKVQMYPLVSCALITVWNSLPLNKCCCVCTASQTSAKQQQKLHSSMSSFSLSWQKC